MQQIQHLHEKQTRNTGRSEVRIIANVRKIIANDRKKNIKLHRNKILAQTCAAFLENLNRSNC
jgi:hypothetical protein